jgi:acyl-phosphate glycerol 3-phosphate acyltransferase
MMFITRYIIKFNLYAYITQSFELGEAWAYTIMAVFLLACVAIPYMIGSLNFGIIISRIWYHDDIRKYGSGNAGATNMLRVWGKGAGGLTLFCDMLKCFAAVIVGVLLMGDIGAAVAGFFCVVGHVFPCWHGFRGGKGVASTAMVALAASPVTFGILAALFVVIVATLPIPRQESFVPETIISWSNAPTAALSFPSIRATYELSRGLYSGL